MTRNALSGRISGTGLISFGDNQIVQFETDWAEIFGLPTNTILSQPIWGIDADGNVCRGTNADDPGDITYKVLTIKETELYCGFRMWDSTNGREVYVQVRDGKFVISEAATPGQNVTTGTWHDKLSFPLAAGVGQNLDFDFTGNALKFLAVSSGEDAIEYAANPGLLVPSCKVVRDVSHLCTTALPYIVQFTGDDWELHGDDQWQPGVYPHGIVVPIDGVYCITAWAAWASAAAETQRDMELWFTPPGNPPVQAGPGILLDYQVWTNVPLASGNFTARISGMYDLAGGAMVSMNVTQHSGGDLNLEAASLSATLISAP